MDKFTLQNPVFATYVVVASLTILKAVSMSWSVVARMLIINGGFRSPEDTKKTLFNPIASPHQTDKDERVERIRRIHLNDVENLPFFLASGLLFVLTDPSLLAARCLMYGYLLSRLAHTYAYWTARTHDTRAITFTIGSVILIYMTCRALLAGLRY